MTLHSYSWYVSASIFETI